MFGGRNRRHVCSVPGSDPRVAAAGRSPRTRRGDEAAHDSADDLERVAQMVGERDRAAGHQLRNHKEYDGHEADEGADQQMV